MLTVDPVCALEVNSEDTKFISEHLGTLYFFDSPLCQKEFEKDPSRFTGPFPDRVHDEHGERIDGSD